MFAEQMGVDAASISRRTHLLDDLHIDSLDGVELLMAFEDKFGVSIPDEDTLQAHTVGDVIDYLDGPGEAGVLSKLKRPPEGPGGSVEVFKVNCREERTGR